MTVRSFCNVFIGLLLLYGGVFFQKKKIYMKSVEKSVFEIK